QYFPQIKKKGLIVDVRGNGGGFVSPLVIERLRRALIMIEVARNGTPQTNPLPLTDGGQLFRPEFAPYSKDGKDWVIEGHGVDPDIVVDNDPAKEFKGEDEQL